MKDWVGHNLALLHSEGKAPGRVKGTEDSTGLNLSAVHLLGTAHLFTRPWATAQYSMPLSHYPWVGGGWKEKGTER